jgi:uncharacterized membrane-anchored protein
MGGVLRGALIALAAIMGVVAGGVSALCATYYACVLHSQEAVQVGWLYCFLTVPAGAGLGGLAAARITARIVTRRP